MILLEQRENTLRSGVNDRQSRHTKLLFDLQRLQFGAFLGQIGSELAKASVDWRERTGVNMPPPWPRVSRAFNTASHRPLPHLTKACLRRATGTTVSPSNPQREGGVRGLFAVVSIDYLIQQRNDLAAEFIDLAEPFFMRRGIPR